MDALTAHDGTAATYLRDCRRLRDALGIAPGAVLEPVPLGMGEHNLNYRFVDPGTGRAFVLRINVAKQSFHKNQVRYEYEALTAVEPSGVTPKPLFIDDSPQAPREGVLVIAFCEGAQLDFDRLREGDLARCARILAACHGVVPRETFLRRPDRPLGSLFAECVERFSVYCSSPVADPHVERRVSRLIRRAQDDLDAYEFDPREGRIVNTEPLASHFLLPDAAADGPGWFVDWERPIVGDVAEDLAFFTAPTTSFWDSEFLFPNSMAAEFLEAYWSAAGNSIVRNGFAERYNAFRRMAAVRAFTWCCRAQALYARDRGLHHTTKAEEKIPVYLADGFLDLIEREVFDTTLG